MQVVPSSFSESFPGWLSDQSASHTNSPCIDWQNIPALNSGCDRDVDSEEDEEEAEPQEPLNEVARATLGDGVTPELVSIA